MLMQALDADQFEDGKLADARGKVGFGELGVEDIVWQIEFEIHNRAASFRNRESIVKRV